MRTSEPARTVTAAFVFERRHRGLKSPSFVVPPASRPRRSGSRDLARVDIFVPPPLPKEIPASHLAIE